MKQEHGRSSWQHPSPENIVAPPSSCSPIVWYVFVRVACVTWDCSRTTWRNRPTIMFDNLTGEWTQSLLTPIAVPGIVSLRSGSWIAWHLLPHCLTLSTFYMVRTRNTSPRKAPCKPQPRPTRTRTQVTNTYPNGAWQLKFHVGKSSHLRDFETTSH